ncbi:MAG TPA: hypothetical protein VKP69_10760 [Isosphaeraceae bacterium]|nr:hypothetical protein [Isosphaeraceae bacterium]
MIPGRRLALRWTIGDVHPRGFEALRLSLWGAWRLFGPEATYAVCVNNITLDRARARTGDLPGPVRWLDATGALPGFFAAHLDEGMAEGVGWKFAPLRLFPDRHELALDNDCILWEMPEAIRLWLDDDDPRRCVIAEDVRPCFGQFASLCGPEPRNSGIRGLLPGFDLEGMLRRLLAEQPCRLVSELDEQGLQVAAVSRAVAPWVVTAGDVTICSPFPPHRPELGRCGAHFVGRNAKSLPWSLEGRPAVDWIDEHWRRRREMLYERVGITAMRQGCA